MKILIPGIDGYIGWPLTLKLLSLRHQVYGIDNLSRRKNVKEMGSISALPILSIEKRIEKIKKKYGEKISFQKCDLLDSKKLDAILKKQKPDVIIHLAEQPSAPFSMIDQKHNIYTQQNNVIGTLNLLHSIQRHVPKAHLVKLGTMGEYGYDPGLEIPEGFYEVEFRGKKATVPFPRLAGSWYHWTKVHDSNNIMFACKLWKLRSTDIMQGIIYGTRINEIDKKEFYTRFDFDESFGTSINRFCTQAVIGYPLSVYGEGGQTRGFLSLSDCIQCITLLIDNPPKSGEYRVVNQFDEQYSILDLAKKIKKIGDKKGLKVQIKSKKNPRLEAEKHYYKADHDTLKKLGFRRTNNIDFTIDEMMDDLIPFVKRIKKKKNVIFTGIKWRK